MSRLPNDFTMREPLASASPLQRDILRVLLYFDIFQHPLSADEIYRYLPSDSTSSQEVSRSCTSLPLASLVAESDGLFSLTDTAPPGISLSLRREKEQRARRMWLVARVMASLIRHFPFVRGVFVSGELSKGVATKRGDVDFFIVTARRRLWVSRALLTGFKKIFLLNSRKFLCLNHFITEDYLEVQERNIYSALELVTLQPLHNHFVFSLYLKNNSWIHEFFPNVQLPDSTERVPPSWFQRFLEFPFRGIWVDRLDRRLMVFWKSTWEQRYSHLQKEKREELFRCEPFISTAYAGDFLSKVLDAYSSRLRRYGLEHSTLVRLNSLE